MGITATSVYAPGDTITSAWANILRTNFSVLDSRTGDDPGAAGLMLVSDGATSAAWVDDNTAVLAGLGFAPLRDTTDTLTGDLTVTGTAIAAGVAVGASGVTITGAGLTATGGISPGNYAGGSTSAGTPSFLGVVIGANGLVVGAGGADINGPLTPDSYAGGSTSTGTPSVKGLIVGTDGIASTGAVAVGGNNVYHAGNPPPGATVPSGLGAWVPTAAAIPSGWTRYTALDGRIPVGAGTTFTVTFTENTDYGASWGHVHSGPSHTHSGSDLSITGTTSGPSATNTTGSTGNTSADGSHTHGVGSLDVAGNTAAGGTADTGSTSWTIPSRAVVWITKD